MNIRPRLLAGVERRFTQFRGDDPLAFVVRRQPPPPAPHRDPAANGRSGDANLNDGQRTDKAKVGKFADLGISPVPQAQAANLMNVSERGVRDPVKVKQKGVPAIANLKAGQHADKAKIGKFAGLPAGSRNGTLRLAQDARCAILARF